MKQEQLTARGCLHTFEYEKGSSERGSLVLQGLHALLSCVPLLHGLLTAVNTCATARCLQGMIAEKCGARGRGFFISLSLLRAWLTGTCTVPEKERKGLRKMMTNAIRAQTHEGCTSLSRGAFRKG